MVVTAVDDARAMTRRLNALSGDELFAHVVERHRDWLATFPGLDQIVADANRYGDPFLEHLYRGLAAHWTAEGLARSVVRARLLAVRQAIRNATPENHSQ